MGVIRDAMAGSGFSHSVLIPVIPAWYPPAPKEKINSPGKQPGTYINAEPNPFWKAAGFVGKDHRPATDSELQTGDNGKGNLGLLLGKPSNGRRYIAVDIDTPKDEPNTSRTLLYTAIEALFRACGGDRWFHVRKTLPYRGAVLFSIPESADPGEKRVCKFSKDGCTPWKIESLTLGEHIVIGGQHGGDKFTRATGGSPIFWYDASVLLTRNKEAFTTPFPRTDMPGHAIPVESVNQIYDAIDFIAHALKEKDGWHHVWTGAKDSNRAAAGTPLGIADNAPPSADHLIQLLNSLPHGDLIDRDVWLRMVMGVAGCVQALNTLGELSDGKEDEILDALVAWNDRWTPTGNQVPQAEEEFREKWSDDIMAQPRMAGWGTVKDIAEHHLKIRVNVLLGATEFSTFGTAPADVTRPLPMTFDTDGTLSALPPPRDATRADITAVGKELAQSIIADSMLTGFARSQIRWISQEKAWIIWGSVEEPGWSRKLSGHRVRNWVEQDIRSYIADYEFKTGNQDTGSAFSKSDLQRVLSRRMISDVEGLLGDRLATDVTDIDRGKYVFQCKSRAIDLRTGAYLSYEAQRDLVDTRRSPVDPKEGACPLFDMVLSGVCNDDPAVIAWMWRWLGYSLIGDPASHTFLFLWGPGGNGKSVVAETLLEIIGDYASSPANDVFLSAGRTKHETGLYALRAKRFGYVSEMPPSEKWNETNLKKVTGQDRVTARRMHADFIEFRPEIMLLMTGQHIPTFTRIDQSVLRRLRIIGSYKVPTVADPTLKTRIWDEERGQILHRLLKEARAVIDADMELPEVPRAMAVELNRYTMDQDSWFGWFRQNCVAAPGVETNIEGLRALYLAWVNRDGVKDVNDMLSQMDDQSLRSFTENLRRVGGVLEDANGRRLRNESGYFVKGVKSRLAAVEDAA